MKKMLALVSGLAMAAGSASAQTSDQQLKESRYQIGQVERVLEGAVEHAATVMRGRLRAVLPADLLLAENARVRGFRLEGYGVLFDVAVPSLQGATLWSFQTLDRNDLGLASALNALRSHVNADGDANLQQALKRVEIEVAPGSSISTLFPGSPDTAVSASAIPVTGSAASTSDAAAGWAAADPGLADPVEAWRKEINNALMDAMLEHSRGLGIRPDEWLIIAARGNYERQPLAPADSDAQTVVIRVRGADLTAFLGGQISRDDARARMDIKVF